MDPETNGTRTVLTSWKEIANYLGKTVRTVQRWERKLGLPVKRLDDSVKQMVIAYPDELENWLRSFTASGGETRGRTSPDELARLRHLTSKMIGQSEVLNQRLAAVIESVNAAQANLRGSRAARSGADARLTGVTILAVDDNEAHNYALSRILESSGSKVLRAYNGEQALAFASEQPNLILLDIDLPDLNGFDVCRRLKSDPETVGIPVVFVTATCRDSEARATAESVGGRTVLFYPVETDHLLAVIEGQIGERWRPAA
jgi:CheY-like chemotaxis protein